MRFCFDALGASRGVISPSGSLLSSVWESLNYLILTSFSSGNSDHSRTATPAPVGASRSHRSSAVMDTPRHAQPVAENGESPSLVMLNRKRNYDAAHLSAGRESSKSRRTTPSPFGGFSRAYDPPSDGEVEIIDLTGYVLFNYIDAFPSVLDCYFLSVAWY